MWKCVQDSIDELIVNAKLSDKCHLHPWADCMTPMANCHHTNSFHRPSIWRRHLQQVFALETVYTDRTHQTHLPLTHLIFTPDTRYIHTCHLMYTPDTPSIHTCYTLYSHLTHVIYTPDTPYVHTWHTFYTHLIHLIFTPDTRYIHTWHLMYTPSTPYNIHTWHTLYIHNFHTWHTLLTHVTHLIYTPDIPYIIIHVSRLTYTPNTPYIYTPDVPYIYPCLVLHAHLTRLIHTHLTHLLYTRGTPGGYMIKTLFADCSKWHFLVLATLHCHHFQISGPILIIFSIILIRIQCYLLCCKKTITESIHVTHFGR